MPKLYVTKRIEFNAAHRLHSEKLSDVENKTIYGKCNNKNGHGHNYVLEITLCGEPDPITGMVMNFRELKRIVEEKIIDRFDHKHLDVDCPEFANVVSTAENIIIVFWDILQPALEPVELYKLTLFETKDNKVEYFGFGGAR
jgi:6-pyruvoyltetrahydropterin/6-carboxytetrahydropterin synthase